MAKQKRKGTPGIEGEEEQEGSRTAHPLPSGKLSRRAHPPLPSQGFGPGEGGGGMTPDGMSLADQQEEKKARKRGRKRAPSDDEAMVNEHGEIIPLPPKHGAPVAHSRPRRRGTGEPMMTMVCHLMTFEGERPLPSLPPTTVPATESLPVYELQEALHRASNLDLFHPSNQDLFLKNPEKGHFDPMLPGFGVTLGQLGIRAPGPHDIYIHLKDTGPLSGLPAPAPLAIMPPPGAEGTLPQGAGSPQGAAASQGFAPGLGGLPGVGPFYNMQPGMYQQVMGAAAGVNSPPMAPGMGALTAPGSGGTISQHHRGPSGDRNRPNKKWTDEEIERLLTGLMKFGLSSWTDIAHRWRFEDRTTVDLKDKWRNLVKNVRDNRPMRGVILTEHAKSIIWRIMRDNNMDLEPQTKPKVNIHADQPQALEAPPQNQGVDQTSPHNPLPPHIGAQGSPHPVGSPPPNVANLHAGLNPHIVLSGQGNPHPGGVHPQGGLGGQSNNPLFVGQQYPTGVQVHHMPQGQQAHMGGQPPPDVGVQGQGDGMTMPQPYMHAQ